VNILGVYIKYFADFLVIFYTNRIKFFKEFKKYIEL